MALFFSNEDKDAYSEEFRKIYNENYLKEISEGTSSAGIVFSNEEKDASLKEFTKVYAQ